MTVPLQRELTEWSEVNALLGRGKEQNDKGRYSQTEVERKKRD